MKLPGNFYTYNDIELSDYDIVSLLFSKRFVNYTVDEWPDGSRVLMVEADSSQAATQFIFRDGKLMSVDVVT